MKLIARRTVRYTHPIHGLVARLSFTDASEIVDRAWWDAGFHAREAGETIKRVSQLLGTQQVLPHLAARRLEAFLRLHSQRYVFEVEDPTDDEVLLFLWRYPVNLL